MAINRRDPAEVRQWWDTSLQLEEHAMRDGILALVNQIHDASAFEEWDVMHDYITLFELGESYCLEEPQLSTYEYGKLAVMTMVAEHHLDLGQFSEALVKLAEVVDLYNARMERYRRLGQPPRRASQVRAHFLCVLARIKWVSDPIFRDAVLTPEQILDQIEETAQNINAYLKQHPALSVADKNVIDGLAINEISCCKLALRYCPDRAGKAVRHFNDRHGAHLSLVPDEFKNIDAAKSNRSSYYWDFELAKLRLKPGADPQDAYVCIELRSMAAGHTFGDWIQQGLLRTWRREALAIVRELKQPAQASQPD